MATPFIKIITINANKYVAIYFISFIFIATTIINYFNYYVPYASVRINAINIFLFYIGSVVLHKAFDLKVKPYIKQENNEKRFKSQISLIIPVKTIKKSL